MSYNVVATENFERKLKKLAKRHKSLKGDLASVFNELAENPEMGTSLGKTVLN